jgi:eukaryotic-like serine/threonine-protein kinase
MALFTGAKLGPYEIVCPLGAGGMGEVYRARDTRLERTVAIKVLNSALVASADVKSRFEREARTISQLNHPNICVLHDVGHEAGIDFLVMEFLDGESLAERLSKGALPLAQALRIAVEIAAALDRAHRAGIVHRDLKPGNVMLTKTGAKLLDFGLAKPAAAIAAGVPGAGTPNTPTMTTASLTAPASPLTNKGSIVGTFQYMAPEVIQGAETDTRSDIFSFGCVLYEMVTGRRAFEGKSQLSALTAILEKEPEPVSQFQPVPHAFERLLSACLAKDRELRMASAHDLKLELEWLASEPAVSAGAIAAKTSFLERVVWITALLLCFAGALYVDLQRRPAGIIRSSILPLKGSILDAPSSPGSFAISPDGGTVVFSALADGVDRLYLRRLRDPDATLLSGTEDGRYPFWSPDSKSIGFFTNHEMRRIDLAGGPPVTLCPAPNGRGGAWAADGNIYFVPATDTDVMRVPASGGTPTIVARVDRPRHDNFRWPILLPDGKHLIFFAGNHADAADERAEIMWASTDGSGQRALMHATSNAGYAGGYLLFTRGATLMAQKLDIQSGRLLSDPQVLVDGVQLDPSTWRASFAVDASGAVLTYIGGAAANITHLMWLDEAGKPLKEIVAPALPNSVRFSRAGNKLLTVSGNPHSSVWISDLARSVTTRLTFDQDHQSAVWSPDGKYIAYCARGATARYFSIWIKAVSGTEPPRQLLDAGGNDCPSDWSPDGKTLALQRSRNNVDIWLLPLDGGKPYPLFDNADGNIVYGSAMFSPDGRWLAYVEGHQGNNIVNIVSFPSRSGKWQVSTTYSALLPFWRADGKQLFYIGDNNDLIVVDVDGSGSEFKVGATRVVARLPLSNAIGAMQTIDVSPSGKGFAAVLRESDSSASLTLVQNFLHELKQ